MRQNKRTVSGEHVNRIRSTSPRNHKSYLHHKDSPSPQLDSPRGLSKSQSSGSLRGKYVTLPRRPGLPRVLLQREIGSRQRPPVGGGLFTIFSRIRKTMRCSCYSPTVIVPLFVSVTPEPSSRLPKTFRFALVSTESVLVPVMLRLLSVPL